MTQVYDEELRPEGLRAPQYTLLQVLALRSGMRQGEIGELLATDSTTLSRTLRGLEVKGWIRSSPGRDRREVLWAITRAGERKRAKAQPAWERAQERMRSRLGGEAMDGLLTRLGHAASTAQTERARARWPG